MNYPLITEYVEAIKSSEENFEQLKNLRPVLDADGEPVFSSGNFAVVFKMKDEQTGKQHAVKCFLREQEGRAEAYRQIAEELEFVSSTFLTPIKYLDKELFVDTNAGDETEFPVLLMDWVEGMTLDKYIRNHLDDQYELSLLAYQFSRLAMWLMPQPFAHGDLKPDNILVKNDGTLVLVDYDGMYVPAMKGQKARELGSPDFRHPNRTETDFDEHIDDFSLVLLLLSLKIIRIDRTFLDNYGNKDNCSVFVDADLRDIANSAANQKLLSLLTKERLSHFYSLFIMVLAEKEIKKDVFEVILKSIISETRNEFLWRKAQKICDEGKALEEQLRKAYKIFLQLSNEQHIEARICLSCCLRNGYGCNKDENEGVQLLRSCCETNNVRAQLSLGLCYEKGKGVPQNYELAIEWYSKAAEQEYHKAQFALGLCYEYGRGVPQSYEQAVEWYRKAAEQEYHKAQFALGLCYEYGRGVPQNFEQAVEWYTKAAIQGSKDAQMKLFVLYGKKQDFQNSIMWLEKAAEHNEIETTYLNFLGLFYEKKNNYQESIKWYKRSADKNDAEAQYKLALFYGLGKGVEENLKVSKVWLKKAAEQGYDAAIKLLSEDEEENLSTEVTDEDLANAWTDEYGVMYSADRKRLLKVTRNLSEYSVLEGTKVICKGAFYGIRALCSINLPNCVMTIGGYAFQACEFLTSIKIPDSVVAIEGGAFYGCTSLLTISIPDSIMYIGPSAFCGCPITSFHLPDSIATIGEGILCGCYNLSSISIPDRVKSIGKDAFSGCKAITSINIPDGVESIGDGAFHGCTSLNSIDLPDSVKSIGNSSFSGCKSLSRISIPEGVISIGDFAFNGCTSITSITIPNSITDIGRQALCYIKGMKTIIIPIGSRRKFMRFFPGYEYKLTEQDNKKNLKTEVRKDDLANAWTDEYGVKYSADRKRLLKAPIGISNYTIRGGTIVICDQAFSNCAVLYSLTIPYTVTTIGRRAFWGCGNLGKIALPAYLQSIGGQAFDGCAQLVQIIIPVGTSQKYESLLSNYKDKVIEQNNGWKEKERRPFSPEEISTVSRAEVVASQYGLSVCFYMNDGCQKYIPLNNQSKLAVGDTLDLKTAKLITLCRDGDDDIYRVIE